MKKELCTYNMTMGFEANLLGYHKIFKTSTEGEKFTVHYIGDKPEVLIEQYGDSYTFIVNGKKIRCYAKNCMDGILAVDNDGHIFIESKTRKNRLGEYVKYCCTDNDIPTLLRDDEIEVYLGKSIMKLGSRFTRCENEKMFAWLKKHKVSYKLRDVEESVYLKKKDITEPTEVMLIVNKKIVLDKDDFIELSNISSDCLDYMNFICRLFDKKYIDVIYSENWINRLEELFNGIDRK